MKLKKGDRIEIFWRDATSLHGWRSEMYIDKDAYCPLCRSVGYFYSKSKKGFVLSRDVESESGERNETEVIPLGMVERVKRLR